MKKKMTDHSIPPGIMSLLYACILLLLMRCDREFDNPNDPSRPFLSPSECTARQLSNKAIQIAWKDNVDFEEGFLVERALKGNPFKAVGMAQRNETGYADRIDTALVEDSIFYRISAFVGGRYSDPAAAPGLFLMFAPTDLNAVVSLNDSTVELTWKNWSKIAEEYHVESLAADRCSTIAVIPPDRTTYGFQLAGGMLRVRAFLRSAASQPSDTVTIARGGNGNALWNGSHKGRINSIDFSPDGREIVTGADDKIIILWKTSGGSPVWSDNDAAKINSVRFDPAGVLVLSAGNDSLVKFRDATTGIVLKSFKADFGRYAVDSAFSFLVVQTNWSDFTVYTIKTGQQKCTGKSASSIASMRVVDGTAHLVIATAGGDIEMWDIQSGSRLWSAHQGYDAADQIALARANTIVLSLSGGDSVKAWNAMDGTKLWSAGHGQPSVFDATIKNIVCGNNDSLVAINCGNDTLLMTRLGNGATAWTMKGQALAFSPDGKVIVLATAYPNVSSLHETGTGSRVWSDSLLTWQAAAARFSPDGQCVCVSASNASGKIKVYRTTDGSRILESYGTGYSFSPDSRAMALFSSNSVALYSLWWSIWQ